MTARSLLWDIAISQHGFVTARQAADLGVTPQALQMLVHRNTLERVAHGVYRYPEYPVGPFDDRMLAVLWTRCPEAAISHETALDAYDISDVNPDRLHLTVGKHRRLRRSDGNGFIVHYQDLTPSQVGWWEQIPTVTAFIAITQCIEADTPTHLLRQAIERGLQMGYLTHAEHTDLSKRLEITRG